MDEDFAAGPPLTAEEWVAAPAEIQGIVGSIDVDEDGMPEPVARWIGRLLWGFAASTEAAQLTRHGWVEKMIDLFLARGEDLRSCTPSDTVECASTVAELHEGEPARGEDISNELAAFFRYCSREFRMQTGEECAEYLEDPKLLTRLRYAVEPDYEEPTRRRAPRRDTRPLAKVLPFRRPKAV